MSRLNRVVAIALPLFMLTALYSQEVVANEWEVVRNEQGIKVSLSEVSDSGYKMFRGETIMSSQLETVMAAIAHAESCNLWRYKCSSFVSLGDGYHFLVNDSPWPLSDRFVIILNTQKERSTIEVTHVPIAKLPAEIFERLPDHQGMVQMKAYNGYWKTEDLGGNRVSVVM